MRLSPGSVLADRYQLVRPLGEGGMGEVWAATHLVTRRPVAVKCLLHTLYGNPDGQALARFVLEAQAACAVEHPNVVEILDFVECGSEPPVIIMELSEGETLASRLSRERVLTLEETARVLLPVVSAVGTAHSRGIVHRDLKPANVFLRRSAESEATVKVLDFGIAKWLVPLAGEQALRTQTGSTLGTPCYMAPEQAIGDRTVDHRVDIWSLGVMLYECLSGARPVEGENAAHMVMRLLSTGIIPIGQLVPALPADLAALIGRMLSREPGRRPDDLREVGAALGPLTSARVPAFAEPRVPSVAATSEPAAFAERSGAPVSSGPKTALSPLVSFSLGKKVTGARASLDRPPERRFHRPSALVAGGALVAGVAFSAAHWFDAARPWSAGTRVTPGVPGDEPETRPAMPASPLSAAREALARPDVDAHDAATVDAPAAPLAPSLQGWVKPPSSRGAPSSGAAAPFSSEAMKPIPAPSNPLDIQLLH